MPNWVQNEIIFENASDEKVAALIRELKLATESDESAFDFNKLIPSYSDVAIDSYSDPEVTEIGEPETVDSGLSISDLI